MPMTRTRRMPRRRRQMTSRRPWYSYGKSIARIAKTAMRTATFVKNLVNAEKKFYDTAYSMTAQSYSGTLTLCSGVTEGTDYNNRVGLSIKPVQLVFRMISEYNTADTADTSQFLRVIVLVDQDNNPSDAPGVSDVLESSGSSADPINSPINHTNGKRFLILRDKVFTLSTNGPSCKIFRTIIPCKFHTKYSNSSTGLRENQIYVLTVSSSATNGPAVQWWCRMRYIDN